MKDLFHILAWLIVIISIFNAIIIFTKLKILKGFLFYFGVWLIASGFMEFLSTTLANLEIKNIYLFHIYSIIEFTIIFFFFSVLFSESFGRKIKFILYSGIILIILNSVFIQPIEVINTYALTCISLGAILLSIFYFVRLIDLDLSLDEKILRMILVGAVFVTHICNLIPFLFGNYLINVELNLQLLVWLIRACVILIVKIIVFYTLLSVFFHKTALSE